MEIPTQNVFQIRHASVGRLLDRLTDARFLSIDFLNTFLLTYRVFTTGLTVIYALKNVLANPEIEGAASSVLVNQQQQQQQQTPPPGGAYQSVQTAG